MNPHTELLINFFDIAFRTLETQIKPTPHWHDPEVLPCWLWKGNMRKAASRDATQLSFTGRKRYLTHVKPAPLLRIGPNRSILVHRLLYLLYRRPKVPITKLKRTCYHENCVNPWHYEALTAPMHRGFHTPWPEESTLHELSQYLSGFFADDCESRNLREMKREILKKEFRIELETTHVILTKKEFDSVKKSAEKPRAAEPNREEKPNPWLDVMIPGELDEDGIELISEPRIERYSKPTEFYDCSAHYIITLRRWYPDLAEISFSEELRSLLEEFSCDLPIFDEEYAEDYRILNSGIDDAIYVFNEAFDKGIKRASELLRRMKSQKFHVRLMLMDMKNSVDYKKLYLAGINWTQ